MGETAREREQCKKEVRLSGSCDCSSCVIDNETQTESINSNTCQTQLCLHTAVKQYIGPKPAAQLRASLACRTINKATVAEEIRTKDVTRKRKRQRQLAILWPKRRKKCVKSVHCLIDDVFLSVTLLLPHTTQHLSSDSRTYRYEAVIDDALLLFYRTVTPAY